MKKKTDEHRVSSDERRMLALRTHLQGAVGPDTSESGASNPWTYRTATGVRLIVNSCKYVSEGHTRQKWEALVWHEDDTKEPLRAGFTFWHSADSNIIRAIRALEKTPT